jgi:hypothetical protein
MKRCFAEPQFVPAVEDSRLAWRKSYRVVVYSYVNRAPVLHEKVLTHAPNSGVAARDFRFRIEARKIDLRKNIGVGIGAPEEVVVFLQDKRGIQLGCPCHD